MKAARLISILAALSLAAMTQQARAVTIDWVTVGNPGNAADTIDLFDRYGAVADEYRIMKFEFTNSQYAVFLNAVDPAGTNPNSVWNSNMGSDARGGITNTGTTNGSRYVVKPNMGNKPVNYVSWWDAARVANWLHNGAQTYGSTDSSASAPQNTGAYTTGVATSGNAVARNSGALVSIPTENQWYKAAYYNPTLNIGAGGYRTFGNGGNGAGVISANEVGDGSGGLFFANYDRGADWNGQDGNVTTVGTNGGASYYGAFDMSGNVGEWNDLNGSLGSLRGIRGGDWIEFDASLLSSSRRGENLSSFESSTLGFRLAAPVPEPSTWVMALAGLAGSRYLVGRRRKRACSEPVSGISARG